CRTIYGWAWDRSRPDVQLSVDIWDGERLLGTVRADRFRQDLLDAGKGSGHAGFVFVPPDDLHKRGLSLIWANVADTSRTLVNSPQPLVCSCQAAKAASTAVR